MSSSKTMKITYTAIMLALLIVVQYITKSFGQFVTGSLVNLILIASVVLGGLLSGCIVAVVSPFLAFLVGIGPAFVQIIPFIALGNLVLVLVYYFIFSKINGKTKWLYAAIAGAAIKFLVLYAGIVKIALSIIPNLKEKQIEMISASFSWPQLVTALIGGVVAFLILPSVQKALSK